MIVGGSEQQKICVKNSNTECAEHEPTVIADKSVRVDLTDALTGVIQGSCDIDAEREKSLKEKYGFGN